MVAGEYMAEHRAGQSGQRCRVGYRCNNVSTGLRGVSQISTLLKRKTRKVMIHHMTVGFKIINGSSVELC